MTAPSTASQNIAQNLAATAAARPDAVALRLDDEAITYTQLQSQVAALAGWLRAEGIEAGDRVVLTVPNVPVYAVVYYAVMRLGGVVVPMNPLFKPREVEFYVQDSGAKLVVGATPDAEKGTTDAGARYVAAADLPGLVAGAGAAPVTETAHRAGDDTAVILYTSGTTGRPKGAELMHSNLQTNLKVTNDVLVHIKAGDVVMGCLPLFHVFGMTCGLNTVVEAGATLTLIPRFDPAKVLDIIERDRVTVFEGVPTMYSALIAAAAQRTADGLPDADVASLRVCISGGASLPVEVMKAFEDRFGCMILEGYGLSETSPVASFNMAHIERRPGTIGQPVPGVEMDVVNHDDQPVADGEVGEIVIRGDCVMKGYWNQPDATATAVRGGWFHSGDLGVREEGYYRIVDRAKDMIIRGGYNVYPREIEEVLYEHPAVTEAAVVAIPDAHLGEEVGAYVALKPGAEVTPEELQAFAKDRLAAYKYPRVVRLIEALPKGATGKILKRELPR